MKNKRSALFLLIILSLIAATLSCNLIGDGARDADESPDTPEPTETKQSIYPLEPLTVDEPGGAFLNVDEGALSVEAIVAVEQIGEGLPFAAGSPLSAASLEYNVDLDEAQQIGEITMTVPLSGATKQSAASSSLVYLTWTEPVGSAPSVVGTEVEGDQATFPIVGSGKYQVFALPSHDSLQQLFSIFDPLAVPTYPQRTPAWCSPTAMTNVVNYHQGNWPVGGFGAVWGESSNWYLAGKAGQPFNKGYFFHWLLGAGGYSVPADVKQSFSNGNVEVIIWNWKAISNVDGYYNTAFANFLFDAYQAYVESFVWGANGARRPVAWGSSLAGHSRTITGSNGTDYYYNDPSSGSHNSTRSWEDYRQAVLTSLSAEKTEVIDTVVFHAPPRPEAERRGVLWLLPRKDDGFPGSVALIDGDTGLAATNWDWDGSMGHAHGYFHQDLRGVLPTDPVFDSQFKALDYQDTVEYGFAVFNISDSAYDYHVDVILQNENLSVLKNVGMFDVSVSPGTRVNQFPAADFSIYNLPSGLYTLKFVLLQNGLYQDVKYVQFRLAPSDLLMIEPHIVLVQNAFCRKGPDPVFDDVTAFVAGTDLDLIGVNPERTWGKVETTINQITFQCWIALSSGEPEGEEIVPVLAVPLFPVDEPADPVCVSTLGRSECTEAGGTYFVGAASASCLCPE